MPKVKLGTILDDDILRDLKEFSGRKGMSICETIEEALIAYCKIPTQGERTQALKRLLSRPPFPVVIKGDSLCSK